MRYLVFSLIISVNLFYNGRLAAQCSGTLGDPIKNEKFGSGTGIFGPSLANGITNYSYVTASPNDGQYTIAKTTSGLNQGWIQNIVNHTPNDPNGYMMIVNASNSPGIFYQTIVQDLCPNTTYEFSAWIINILRNPGIKPNVKFTIENDGVELLQIPFETGDIAENSGWIRYATTFVTPSNLGTITLKMTNKNPGGNGNDLALDDIAFSACGPSIIPTIANNLSTKANLCAGESQVFNLKTEITAGVYQNPKYQWQVNSGNGFVDLPGEKATALTINFVNASPGNYQYRLLAAEGANINSPNCRIASGPLTIEVNPLPIARAENSGPFCTGNTIQLTASGGTSYSWTGPNGFTSTAQNPTLTNATKTMEGEYTVTVMASDCSSNASTNVQVSDPLQISTNVQTVSICEGKSVQLTASGGTEYLWQPANGLSDPNSANPVAAPAETTTYTVKVSQGLCSETAQVTVNVNKNAMADAGADQKIVNGQKITLNGKVSSDVTYLWTPADYLDDPAKLNPVATPPHDITYTLHASSNLGCSSSSDEVNITVYPKVVIPNTFSPNGDNVNDTWNIPAAASFPNPVVKIINRYGSLVYQSTGPFKPWDGKMNGKDLPPGVYYYSVYLNEDFQTYTGWLMLVR